MESIRKADIKGKKVIVRVDYNVPLKNGKVVENDRIKESLETINYLLENNCKIILMSHLGRPKGRQMEFSLEPVASELSSLLKRKVQMMDDCIDMDVQAVCARMKEKDIFLLENTRFYEEDQKNDAKFAKALASLADVFVMEAFGTAHRADASTLGIQSFLSSYMGFLVEREITNINKILESKEKPFVVVLGGAKVSDKIEVIKYLLPMADKILIGGGMPFPFLMLKKYSVGNSIINGESLNLIRDFYQNEKIMLPDDFLIGDTTRAEKSKAVSIKKIPDGMLGLDIGPKTIKKYSDIIKSANKVIWNGPMGLFENKVFSAGTKAIGEAVAAAKLSLVGGGETVTAINQLGVKGQFTHVSTGGGAMLDMLAGKKLVALK